MHKFRSTILVAIALASVALMLVPTGAAQGTVPAPSITNIKVGTPTVPIKPAIENPAFKVTFVYKLGTQAQVGNAPVSGTVTVTMLPTCTNGVLVTGPTTTVITIPPQTTSDIPGEGNFQISIPRTAPGLTPLQCSFKISASSPNPSVPAVPDQTATFSVTADYYSVNQVKLNTKLKQSGPQKQVPFEMEISNFGNARTQYTFELTNKPTGKWNAILPEVLLVDSPNSGAGSSQTTTSFTVATPFKNGWNNLEGAYQVTIKPSSADDPSKAGNPLTANMLVRVRGVYVPGLEPAIMLGAILGSALVLRLRKAE
jgi:hypothetical protein